MGPHVSVSCFGELHTPPCSVCLIVSRGIHEAWERGDKINFLEVSVTRWNALFSNPTKPIGAACHRVEESVSIQTSSDPAIGAGVELQVTWAPLRVAVPCRFRALLYNKNQAISSNWKDITDDTQTLWIQSFSNIEPSQAGPSFKSLFAVFGVEILVPEFLRNLSQTKLETANL